MADYAGVLADLKARRELLLRELAGLDGVIGGLERLSSNSASSSENKPTASKAVALLDSAAFSGLNLRQAITKYLRAEGHPRSTRQIVDGLTTGGFRSDSAKPYAIVYNTLHRLKEGDAAVFAKMKDGTWWLRNEQEALLGE